MIKKFLHGSVPSKLMHKCLLGMRLTVSQYVLVSSTLVGLATRYYFLSGYCCLKFAVLYLLGALSDERTGLQFAVYSLNCPSRSQPETILYCLSSETPPTWRARFPYLYPQEQGGPVIPPGTGLPLRLLRLAGLRWGYSNPPPTWRARFPYLYPQEQDSPVIPPGTGLPLRRLLRLAGLR
jgi:hypothetical protein